ncbi:MAG: hypothetical protein GXP08_13450 [Gammaproteobacteria bacterium]|nr:hypothetical protein [Gammaproteobacteria bacterium]
MKAEDEIAAVAAFRLLKRRLTNKGLGANSQQHCSSHTARNAIQRAHQGWNS